MAATNRDIQTSIEGHFTYEDALNFASTDSVEAYESSGYLARAARSPAAALRAKRTSLEYIGLRPEEGRVALALLKMQLGFLRGAVLLH